MIGKKLLLLSSFIFAAGNVYAQYAGIFEPSVPKQILIKADKSVFDEYQKTLREAYEDKSANIPDEYKKTFVGEFYIKDGLGEKKCTGKFRINGDWKDHIDQTKKTSSLDVSLINKCYIGDIAKFKLFLPKTRNGNNEVFWSILLDYYGFPTLYTRLVDVDFNGVVYKAIFQEKPSTAFLERHGLREMPILKHDERQIWLNRKEWFTNHAKLSAVEKITSVFDPSGHAQNIDGVRINDVDASYGLLFNSEFLKTDLRYRIALNALTSYRNEDKIIENSRFYEKISRSYAPHGLINHNRRFIYNAFTDTFIPLYYDGDVDLFEDAACEQNNNNGPTDEFMEKYTRLTNESLTNGMRCAYARVYDIKTLSNWSLDSAFKMLKPVSIEYMKVGNLKTGFDGIKENYVYTENYAPFVLNPNNGSNEGIPKNQLKHYLIGNSYSSMSGYKISTVVAGEKHPSLKTQGVEAPETGEVIITVPDYFKYYIYVPEGSNRKIDIRLAGTGSRVLLTGQMSKSDKVSISGDAPNVSQIDRHDDQMITGCATFYKFKFNGGSIYSDTTGCEDSINIFSSAGIIDNIEVHNASADAIDFDFSKITVLNTVVENAGNDCIDLSSGDYIFVDAKLSGCLDKGVSIGERSNATLNNITIISADIGIAVKDQSDAKIGKLTAKAIKSTCTDSYIKKGKFGTPALSVENKVCD